jgi:hypothetical protein
MYLKLCRRGALRQCTLSWSRFCGLSPGSKPQTDANLFLVLALNSKADCLYHLGDCLYAKLDTIYRIL